MAEGSSGQSVRLVFDTVWVVGLILAQLRLSSICFPLGRETWLNVLFLQMRMKSVWISCTSGHVCERSLSKINNPLWMVVGKQ